MPDPCPQDRDWAGEANAAAQAAFPGVPSRPDTVEAYGSKCLIRFGSRTLDLPEQRAVLHLRLTATVDDGVTLMPFHNVALAGAALDDLRRRPEIVAAWGDRSLECLGGTDWPGRAGWMRCSPEAWGRRDSTPSGGEDRYGTEREEVEVVYPSDDGPVQFHRFALPVTALLADAPWWAGPSQHPDVVAFRERHADVRVIGVWHYRDGWTLVLRPTEDTAQTQLRVGPGGEVLVEARYRHRPPNVLMPDGRTIPMTEMRDADWTEAAHPTEAAHRTEAANRDNDYFGFCAASGSPPGWVWLGAWLIAMAVGLWTRRPSRPSAGASR